MPIDDPFLGTGWSFPPSFDNHPAAVDTTSGLEDIRKSLEIIFTTTLGERIMQPTFGCSLDEQVFEAMNSGRLTYIENLVKTAILHHEPRIDADKVEVRFDPSEGTLWIHIGFKVRTSNSRFNFVFPYYLTEKG